MDEAEGKVTDYMTAIYGPMGANGRDGWAARMQVMVRAARAVCTSAPCAEVITEQFGALRDREGEGGRRRLPDEGRWRPSPPSSRRPRPATCSINPI